MKDKLKMDELRKLYERSMLILTFINSKNKNSTLNKFMEVTEQVYKNNDLKGMRYISKDTTEYMKSLPKKDYEEISNILKYKLNEKEYDSHIESILSELISNNKISNNFEFKVVELYLDNKLENDKRGWSKEQLESLLLDYQKTKNK